MGTLRNLAGQVFTRLTVVSRAEISGPVRWICNCKCGGTRTVLAKQLLSGRTRSCGCLHSNHGKSPTHGMSRTRLYKIWQGIRERCNNPKTVSYANYGGRGIRVCREWDSGDGFTAFQVWAQSSGYSDDLTIDRKDNDGNYEPGNCQWATMLTQSNNKRGNHFMTFRGETKTASEFARQYGLNVPTVFSRLRYKWPVEKIFTTSPRGRSQC